MSKAIASCEESVMPKRRDSDEKMTSSSFMVCAFGLRVAEDALSVAALVEVEGMEEEKANVSHCLPLIVVALSSRCRHVAVALSSSPRPRHPRHRLVDKALTLTHRAAIVRDVP